MIIDDDTTQDGDDGPCNKGHDVQTPVGGQLRKGQFQMGTAAASFIRRAEKAEKDEFKRKEIAKERVDEQNKRDDRAAARTMAEGDKNRAASYQGAEIMADGLHAVGLGCKADPLAYMELLEKMNDMRDARKERKRKQADDGN